MRASVNGLVSLVGESSHVTLVLLLILSVSPSRQQDDENVRSSLFKKADDGGLFALAAYRETYDVYKSQRGLVMCAILCQTRAWCRAFSVCTAHVCASGGTCLLADDGGGNLIPAADYKTYLNVSMVISL